MVLASTTRWSLSFRTRGSLFSDGFTNTAIHRDWGTVCCLVVIDNHSANVTAKGILKEKRPSIFWTSCAIDTIDLMLQDNEKLTKFKNTIHKIRELTTFIYSHHRDFSSYAKLSEEEGYFDARHHQICYFLSYL